MSTKSGVVIKEGDWVSLDGAKGQIIEGKIPTVQVEMTGNFGKLMTWVDEIKTMKVRANAETPKDAKQARDFGAEGIGLARTEHMFFDANRIADMRAMICPTMKKAAEKLWLVCCRIRSRTLLTCSRLWTVCR